MRVRESNLQKIGIKDRGGDMIKTGGLNLYTATEVSEILGVTKETLGLYAKSAEIEDRRICRVRYYTEEEIRRILQKRREGADIPEEPEESGVTL